MKIDFLKLELWISFNKEKQIFTIQIENLGEQIDVNKLLEDDEDFLTYFFAGILDCKKVIDFYKENETAQPDPSSYGFDIFVEGPTVWLYDELQTRDV